MVNPLIKPIIGSSKANSINGKGKVISELNEFFFFFIFFFFNGALAHIGPWPPLYEVP
jgi:hypothetical protein